jgi:hypothetical protein
VEEVYSSRPVASNAGSTVFVYGVLGMIVLSAVHAMAE